ncbi:MAG: flagellar basal-body MS-ring/collar protein FliF [Candidatus Latescibacterota bacterium]|nr:flagellar basal-body MS-ring/collar protein FliF [Candidatus Latescibacterota bacterium]
MNLPTQISDITDRSRSWWDEAPPTQRYGVMGFGALLVIVVIFAAISGIGDEEGAWEGRILYANLEFEEAAEISNRLRIMEVPHRLTPDATTILVPEDQYMDLRITLAGEGFPKSGRIGYEIFDDAQLAMTDFLQQVNFLRALQAELEETLVRIDGIRDARVHLVIPEPSLFTEEQNPVTASVQLSLGGNVKLKRDRVDAIGYLISASVEGLDIEQVVILDDGGNLLSEEKDPLVKMANKQFEMQQQVEKVLERKVQTLMDQVIGTDRSRVRVNVALDFDRTNIQRETFEPGATQVIISEETSETSSAEQGTEEQAIRNYEVNRSVHNIIGSVGSVKRISMALTVDKTKVVQDAATQEYIEEDRSQEEIDQLAGLAEESIGLDRSRGDEITVFAMHFDKTQEIKAREDLEATARQEFWTDIAILVAKFLGIIVALITLRFIIQAIGRGVGVEEELEVLGEVAADIEEEEFERPETPHEMILSRVQNMVRERPEDAAKLIRTMLMEEGT